MEFVTGILGGLAVCAFATLVGFDRDRAFYPVMLTVIAGYYLLFAAMSGSPSVLILDGAVMVVFVGLAVAGFKSNMWLVVAGLLAHGVMDLFHPHLIENPGAPRWWPMFCLSFDVVAASYLGLRIWLSARPGRPARARGLICASALAAIGAGAVFGADSQASTRGGLEIAQVDGRQVAYRVTGEARPVLVLLSGLGEGMSAFTSVAPDLARDATVISYDRAGYGMSTPPNDFRDAAAVDRELVGLLKATGVAGPYVLVGHSTGGLYAEYFAARHPELVSGLILVDARPATFTDLCRQAGLNACVATASMVRFAPKGAQAEVTGLHAAATAVEALSQGRPVPTLVLSRSRPARPTPFERVWAMAQDILARRHPGSTHLIAPQGGHDIHRSARTWFIASVRNFLQTPR